MGEGKEHLQVVVELEACLPEVEVLGVLERRSMVEVLVQRSGVAPSTVAEVLLSTCVAACRARGLTPTIPMLMASSRCTCTLHIF